MFKKVWPFFLIGITVALLIFFWFKEGNLIGTAESGLPFYNLDRQYQIAKYAWADPALGTNTSIIVGTAPTYWFLSHFQKIGIPGFLIEAAVLFILLEVGGIFIFLLTKQLFPDISNRFALLATAFYLFNPYVLVNIWVRFLTNHIFSFVFFPLALYLFIRGLKSRNFRFAVALAIISLIFSFALTSIPTNLLLWGIFIYATIFFAISDKQLRDKIFYLKFFSLTLILYILVNFWWLGQFTLFFFSQTKTEVVSSFFSGEGNISTLSILSGQLGQLINILRLMHGTFFQQGHSWAQFLIYPPIVFVEFLITGLIFWCIFFYRKNINVLFLASIFLVGLFLTKGSSLPFGELFEFVFVSIPSFQVFRNPFEKFGLLVILAAAPLFAQGIRGIVEFLNIRWSRSGKVGEIIYGAAIFFMLFVWGVPFWTGDVFSSYKSISDKAESYQVEVPSYYREANEWFNKQSGIFRFISLPLGGEGITYNWDKPYIGVDLSSTFFDIPNISNNTTVPFYFDFVSEMSNYQLSEKILEFMPFVNGRYILLRKDIDFKANKMADPQALKLKLTQMVDKGLLSKKADLGQLEIYEIDSQLFWPKIFITQNILVGNKPDLFGFKDPLAIISSENAAPNLEKFGKFFFKADKVYFPPVGETSLPQLRDEDLLANLSSARFFPGKAGYSLSRLKENLELPIKGDYWNRIYYKTNLLGKRVLEIYRLKKQGADLRLVDKTEETYQKQLNELSAVFLDLGRSGAVPAAIQQSLLIQYILLKRVDSSSQYPLKQILVELRTIPQFELPVGNERYIIYRFKLSHSGDYKLTFPKGFTATKSFLDGQPVNYPTEENAQATSFAFREGVHELSMSLSDSSLWSEVLSIDNLHLKDIYDKEFALLDLANFYQLDFDYRLISGNEFQIILAQDIDKKDSPILANKLKGSGDWQHWQSQFASNTGASLAKLTVQSSPPFDLEIKNLKIKGLMQLDPILTSSSAFSNNSETSWEWTRVNPALYKIKIKKPTDKVELLVFSELFNSNWKIYPVKDEGATFVEEQHFLVNSYANGWLLEKKGEYDLALEFMPQRILNSSRIISASSFLLLGLYLGWFLISRKYYKGQKSS